MQEGNLTEPGEGPATDRLRAAWTAYRAAEGEQEANAISSALREQGEASNQIAGHVEQIAQMSEENNRGAENTADLSGSLSSLAQHMRSTAERFRL